MSASPVVGARRRGRPPGESSAETERRILDTGRRLFSEYGFAGTTNRMLAEAAGVTTNALYHYFPSKLDLYAAVHAVCLAQIRDAIDATMGGDGSSLGFVESVLRLLDATEALIDADRTLPRFITVAGMESARREELSAVAAPLETYWLGVLTAIADRGVRTGLVAETDHGGMVALLMSMLIGLNEAAVIGVEFHRQALATTRRLVRGALAGR